MSSKNQAMNYVIVRAFRDEPVKLRAVAVRGRVVDVVGADDSLPMPFHIERTYRFDEKVFREMRLAFENDKIDELNRLWDRAELFRARELAV